MNTLKLINKFIEDIKTRDLSKLEVGDNFPVHMCDKGCHYLLTATVRSIRTNKILADTKYFKNQFIYFDSLGIQKSYCIDLNTERLYCSYRFIVDLEGV